MQASDPVLSAVMGLLALLMSLFSSGGAAQLTPREQAAAARLACKAGDAPSCSGLPGTDAQKCGCRSPDGHWDLSIKPLLVFPDGEVMSADELVTVPSGGGPR